MIRRTSFLAFSHSDRLKVGILGSGISGCTVASTLLESSSGTFDITLYEAGSGIGGRTSTRRYVDESGNQISQFDHGCQSIHPPKTVEFQSEFNKWEERGWIRPWDGKFGTIGCATTDDNSSDDRIVFEQTKDERYVGCPRMSSICENLLQTKSGESTIKVVTKTHANAVNLSKNSERRWKLENNSNHGVKILGEYDWLIVTDRNSAKTNRFDLVAANVDAYTRQLNKRVESIPSMTTMVTLHKPLPMQVDELQLDYYSNPKLMKEEFGSLGWIARDSSKPGRRQGEDNDDSSTTECWVLQANQREAKRLLSLRELNGASLKRVQEKIRKTMVDDFIKSIPKLISIMNNEGDINVNHQEVDIPPIISSTGHRWGAAFPLHIERRGKENMFLSVDQGLECHVKNIRKKFIACGDYFGEHHGTVEGAFLSGRAAANHLIQQVTRLNNNNK